jgi:hypothetical protein
VLPRDAVVVTLAKLGNKRSNRNAKIQYNVQMAGEESNQPTNSTYTKNNQKANNKKHATPTKTTNTTGLHIAPMLLRKRTANHPLNRPTNTIRPTINPLTMFVSVE